MTQPSLPRQHIVDAALASQSRPVPYPRPADGAPNVLMVVLDDVGFAQLGCYGSGIRTPRIDEVAAQGLRYQRFHVTAVCSATRGALLTGRNHHAVGMGVTEEAAMGFPGYTGRIPRSAATMARLLRDSGYNTMAVGKWHLTPRTETSAAGPFERWPLGQGFEKYYGFLGAETSQWAPELVRDNHHVEPPATPEEGYHLTEDLVDEAIRMIQDQQQATTRKPFFCYLAPGAAHAPHQVAPEWVEPYEGAFDQGWEAYREEVFARQLAAGVAPEGTVLTPRPDWVPDWTTLSDDERRLYARYMEVFAGFMTHTDHHLGRLFDFLEEIGVADDTIVMVLSDNGASAEGGPSGTPNEAAGWLGLQPDAATAVERLDELGGHDASNHYPWGWAWAGNTPLQLWKRYSWLGGVRAPLVLRWPSTVPDPGALRSQFTHVVDLFPTVLAAAGVEHPEAVDGVTQQPVDGTSFLDHLTDGDAAEHRPMQYFEMMGSRSLYLDGWKATTDHVANQFGERDHLTGSFDHATDRWSLFDLRTDFAEAVDVADEHPDLVRRMEGLWWAEAGRNNVLPLFEFPNSMFHLHPGEFPPPTEATYRPGGAPVVEPMIPSAGAGFSIRAHVEVPEEGASGVLAAIGDHQGGWGVYLLDGRPTAVFALLDLTDRVSADAPVPPGRHVVGLDFKPADAEGPQRLELTVDEEVVATGQVRGTFFLPQLSSAAVGLTIGRDRGLPLSADYVPPFAFTGTLEKVVMRSGAGATFQVNTEDQVKAAVAGD